MDSPPSTWLSPEAIGLLVGAATGALLHVLNALIPKGHHFKFMDRWIRPNDDRDDDVDG